MKFCIGPAFTLTGFIGGTKKVHRSNAIMNIAKHLVYRIRDSPFFHEEWIFVDLFIYFLFRSMKRVTITSANAPMKMIISNPGVENPLLSTRNVA